MKNQYFGDINDFQKYAILRLLAKTSNLRIGLCWMLTADDQRNDGRLTHYLAQENQWKPFDPALFDFLHQTVHLENQREIATLESQSIISNAKYYPALLTDSHLERKAYFNEMIEHLAETDLIFFDPDNGLEVSSISLGRRTSSKYLYYDEVREVYQRGCSLLIYQHFPRRERNEFIEEVVGKIKQYTGANEVHAIATSRVAYFLVSQPKHTDLFQNWLNEVRVYWKNHVNITSL